MFPSDLNLAGDFDALAAAYGRFLPNGTVARSQDWRLFRWQGHLTIADCRSLWRIRTNRDISMHSDGNDDFFALVLPEEGGVCTEVRGRPILAAPSQAVLLHRPEDRDLHALCLGAHARTSIKWHIAEWHKTVAASLDDGRVDESAFNPLINLSDQRGQVLSRLISAVAHDLVNPLPSSQLASSLMDEALLRLLFEHTVLGDGAAPVRQVLPRHVRLAVDYMRANVGTPILIREVAAACGVTVRALEQGFRRSLDTTPLAYLRKIRLDAARLDLQLDSGRHSIGDVARRWGFVDLGRFSARYRQAYGELPSQTRRRR
jgi:AraC-like DNA-binding protein